MPPWLTVTQVATTLHTHPEVVRRWLRQGHLHGTKFGRAWRVPIEAVTPKATASLGVNVLHGCVGRVDARRGIAWVMSDGAALAVQGLGMRRGARVRVHLRAADILVSRHRLRGVSARNQWSGTVESLLHQAGGVAVHVRTRPALVAWMTHGAVQDLKLRPGVAVVLVFKAGACEVHVDPGPYEAAPPRRAMGRPRRRRRAP